MTPSYNLPLSSSPVNPSRRSAKPQVCSVAYVGAETRGAIVARVWAETRGAFVARGLVRSQLPRLTGLWGVRGEWDGDWHLGLGELLIVSPCLYLNASIRFDILSERGVEYGCLVLRNMECGIFNIMQKNWQCGMSHNYFRYDIFRLLNYDTSVARIFGNLYLGLR